MTKWPRRKKINLEGCSELSEDIHGTSYSKYYNTNTKDSEFQSLATVYGLHVFYIRP